MALSVSSTRMSSVVYPKGSSTESSSRSSSSSRTSRTASPIPQPHFSKHLMVLDLNGCNLRIVPDSIGDLIHLRYLSLSHSEIKYIPESVCKLFNLQTLELKECWVLMGIPKGLKMLKNMRHLNLHLKWENITDSTKIVVPQGISELHKLQTLSRFNVNSVEGQDCNLIELKYLNLRGNLCLLNLEKVITSVDAMNANLQGKKHLKKLMLRWDSSAHTNCQQIQLSEEVINFLQPNNSLRCLWMINYPGTKYPDWMGYSSFSSLETIKISNCKKFNFLRLLGQLPWLENLQIDNVHAKIMGTFVGFPSLEHISLLNMPSLERIPLENEIPTLNKLYVSDCPYLKELVLHESLHGKFEKQNCPNLSTIIWVPRVEELPNSFSTEDKQEVNQNSMCQIVVGNTVIERMDVNDLTEEEIETVGESIKEWLRKGKSRLTRANNWEDERAAKRRVVKNILRMVAESCSHFQSDGASNSGEKISGGEQDAP